MAIKLLISTWKTRIAFNVALHCSDDCNADPLVSENTIEIVLFDKGCRARNCVINASHHA
jgi:hypothetical protein